MAYLESGRQYTIVARPRKSCRIRARAYSFNGRGNSCSSMSNLRDNAFRFSTAGSLKRLRAVFVLCLATGSNVHLKVEATGAIPYFFNHFLRILVFTERDKLRMAKTVCLRPF
jgi:hypothetical protein